MTENKFIIKDGYMLNMPIEAAVDMLNSIFLNPNVARGNGKSRIAFNQTSAWLTVLAALDNKGVVGEWIYSENEFDLPKCSICGMTSHDATFGHRGNYCSCCGAKMVKPPKEASDG